MVNKGPFALFLYARELMERDTQLVLETGTQTGGSALWFAVSAGVRVITFDNNDEALKDAAKHPLVEFRGESLTSPLDHDATRVTVSLDSNHTADHIERELERFAPCVTVGQLLVVEDVDADPKTRAMVQDWEKANPQFSPRDWAEVEHFKVYERTR